MSTGSKIQAELKKLTLILQEPTKKVSNINNQCGFWGTYCVGFVVH